jgi:hypothetical protein
MYRYASSTPASFAARTAQFKDQVERRLKGELTEDDSGRSG